MPIRDFLKKKDKIEEVNSSASHRQPHNNASAPPEFKIMRSDTNTEEIIEAPSYPGDSPVSPPSPRRSFGRSGSYSKASDGDGSPQKERRSLADRLHLHRDRSRSPNAGSTNLPQNMPDIQDTYSGKGDVEDKEAQWEERATMLAGARKSPGLGAVASDPSKNTSQLSLSDKSGRPASASDEQSDVNIQDAIKLHEDGNLAEAAEMFKELADRGNVLSAVLYGLSLRHGWGCPKDEKRAFVYLSSAATDSAALESEALKHGIKKGGAAKGELVLAIFELGNCYRYGWGTSIDKTAARYYPFSKPTGLRIDMMQTVL